MEEQRKTLVSVEYQDKKTGEFGGRAYTYYSELDVKVGDLVVAPTSRGGSVARICEADVPLSRVDERIEPLLKTITHYAETSTGSEAGEC